ncbi:MAG: TonB-dependent receptor [Myxococcales bacterium]|nr:TonB-dependent receptor [Myxococcales bacterium]MDH5565401.1 TonB-dependent receptor [Myxococcales bacterium]
MSRFAALVCGLAWLVAWSASPVRAAEPETPPEPADAVGGGEDEELEIGVPASASATRSEGIEDILVTAQGREQTVQEASVSVAAFSVEYLEALGAQNIADLSQFTPNLEIRTVFSASNPTLFIRGVGLRDFNANSSSSVAVYNDDVYMNSPAGQLGQLFDLQGVEILRGPQGALYGRNASAGAIRVITRKPLMNEFNGFANVSYGRFDQIDVEGALEVPLVTDLLGLRVSGVMHRRDGTTVNRCADDSFWRSAQGATNEDRRTLAWRVFSSCFNGSAGTTGFVGTRSDPSVGGQGWDAGGTGPIGGGVGAILDASNAVVPDDIARKVNDVENWAGRGLLRLHPADGSDWILNVHGGRNRALARQFQMLGAKTNANTGEPTVGANDIDGYSDPDTVTFGGPPRFSRINPTSPEDGDVFQGDYNRTGPERLDLLGANLSGEISIGDFALKSVTAYEWNDRLVLSNVDANPYIGLEVDFSNTAWQLSQELKTLWDAGGTTTWQAGSLFLYENLDVLNDFRTAPTVVNRQDYTQKTYYGALYGYFSWAPLETFSIEGGARWNIEHKDFAITADLISVGVLSQEQTADVTKQAPTGDISINYRPHDDVNLYAKFSRGWKGAHFNGNVITSAGDLGASLVEPVRPEKVNALEIGLKSKWLDERLRFHAAAFYYDYEDHQIFQVRNSSVGTPVQELLNADDADVYGVELELEARPLDGWAPGYLEGLTLFASFAWLESSYTDFTNERGEVVSGRIVTRIDDFSGQQLINAPRHAFTGYAQWDLGLGRYGTLVPRFDWSFKDRVYFSPQNIEPVSQEALWLMNARLGYRTPDEHLEIAGWVRNLTDQIYRIDVIDISRFQQSILYAIGDPRTYGVTLSVQF